MGKSLSEEEVLKLADHLSFSSMSKNKATNNEFIAGADQESHSKIKFMRKGEVRILF